ncbi:hypothetical protein [Marinicauda pacifica]|jgi:membrane associated rhomboid family serine protease|uniref:hypothetical protein n=1 Tax=Marinicauda pacifica TaxID=1133559 RepID=UPI0035C79162
MASEGQGTRTRIKALIAGFAAGVVAMPLIAWLVGNIAYGVIAGLMAGAALAAIFQDRVSRRRPRDGEDVPPE